MPRKRLNKNVVVGLTLLGLLMILFVSVLMLRQLAARDPEYYESLAEKYLASGDFKTAALFYKEAWDHSQDPAYLVPHGQVLLNEGSVRDALNSWRVALMNDPSLVEAHHRRLELLMEMAELYRRMGDWELVQEAAEQYLELEDDLPVDRAAFAYHALGQALTNLSQRDPSLSAEGEAALRKAMDLAPGEVTYAIDLAVHLANEERFAEAEALFDELMAAHEAPGAIASRVRLAYAQYLARRDQRIEAERMFRESLSLAKDAPAALRDTRLGYADYLTRLWAIARRDGEADAEAQPLFDRAESLLTQCIEADASDFQPYLQLAVLYRSAQRPLDAIAICDARLSQGLSRKGIEADRNRLNAFSLMIHAAEACVVEAVSAQQAGDQQRREEYLTRAEQYVADARGEYPEHPRVFKQSAKIKIAQGLDRPALDDLREADERYRAYDRIDWETKELLARLHLKLGEAGAARSVLESVADAAGRRRTGGLSFWVTYAQALYETDEISRAQALVDQVLAAEPENVSALRLRAAIYERQGRSAEATQIVEALTESRTFRPLREANQLALEGQPEQALAVLRAALEEHPGDVGLVRAAVRQLVQLGRRGEAQALVREAMAIQPEDPTLQKLSVLTREDLSEDERRAALVEVVSAQEDAYQRALELLGIYWQDGDHAEALAAVNEALAHLRDQDTPLAQKATTEQHRMLLVAKLALAKELGDEDAARDARDAAVKYNVDGAYGKSVLGLYHMHRENYELASRAFREALQMQPTDARTLTRLGQCLLAMDDTDEARRLFDRAISLNPRLGEAHKALAVLAKQTDDTETYEKALSQAEKYLPTDRWVQAEVEARQEAADPEAAIARREARLEEDRDDFENVLRLAELSRSAGDRERADRYHRKLLELRPADRGVAATVSRYFLATDRPEASKRAIERHIEACASAEAKAGGHLLLASHYLEVGDPDAAERALLSGVDVAETLELARSLAEFYLSKVDRPERALPWLEKAAAIARAQKSEALPEILANRITALLDRDVDDLGQARAELETLRSNYPDYVRGLLLASEVHARRGDVKAAVDALTAYLAERPNDAYALYQRALHRRAQGRLGPAITDLETIKRTNPAALELRPRLLLAELRRQAGEPGRWVEELESLVAEAPESAAALEALVRAYVQRERLTDAERVLTARINRAAGRAAPRWYFLRGDVLLAQGQDERGLADFRRGAEVAGHTADAVARVISAYLRVDRAADALAYYQRHAPETAEADATLMSQHAILLARDGQSAAAVTWFRRAMVRALDESVAAARRVAADVQQVFDPEDAIGLFEADSMSGPLAQANDRILADVYQRAGRFDRAAELLKVLAAHAETDGERAELLAELGNVLQSADRLDDARRAYEEALKYNDRHWIAMNNLAYLLADRMGEHRQALPYAQRAVAIVDTADTLDTLGWIYVGLGEYSPAIAELSRAVRLNPGDPLPYYHLGEAYRRSGRFDEALSVLQSGKDLATEAGQDDFAARFEASIEKCRGEESGVE